MAYQEHHHEREDGHRIYVRQGEVDGEVLGEVLVTHGRGEHCGCYEHVAEVLARRGLRMWGYDLRGHGRSGGTQGDIPSYEALLGDQKAVEGLVRASGKPYFLLGHSLGGQIVLNSLIEGGAQCQGAVVTSPFLRLAFVPALWRRAVASLMGNLWPGYRQQTLIPPSQLTRDLEHFNSLPGWDLRHTWISARMYFAIVSGAARALGGANRLKVPVLLIHGGADPVTCAEATQDFYERLESNDKRIRVFPEMLHETHNDLGREQVLAEITEWIEARCP